MVFTSLVHPIKWNPILPLKKERIARQILVQWHLTVSRPYGHVEMITSWLDGTLRNALQARSTAHSTEYFCTELLRSEEMQSETRELKYYSILVTDKPTGLRQVMAVFVIYLVILGPTNNAISYFLVMDHKSKNEDAVACSGLQPLTESLLPYCRHDTDNSWRKRPWWSGVTLLQLILIKRPMLITPCFMLSLDSA